MPPLTVALEISTLTSPSGGRGLGRYTRSCQQACATSGFDVRPVALPDRPSRYAEWTDVARRTRSLARETFDVFHATHPHVWGYTRRPTVVTVHDVVQFDAAAYRRTGVKARAFYHAVQYADHLIAVSSFTESRLHALYPRTVGKTSVVPSPPSAVFSAASSVRADYDASKIFTLVDMASPDPRKRAAWLAPLASLLKDHGLRLVVAGANTDSLAAREELGEAEGIGRVDDQTLTDLLTSSACFVYLSAYEGQGLPPLEAMAAGLPVVAVSNTAITEVVADGGTLVEETAASWDDAIAGAGAEGTLADVAAACARIAGDTALRNEHRARALTQAGTFTEERFNAGLSAAYEAAIARSER